MNRRELLLVLVSAAFPGCGGTSEESVRSGTIRPPASWTADGRTWSHQPAMSKPDEELLTKFFHLHPGFQGSSDFEGVPTMMIGEKSDRRFYWIRGDDDSAMWSCIHFESGRFRTSEGAGNPF